jgi:hypothetical protein
MVCEESNFDVAYLLHVANDCKEIFPDCLPVREPI